MLCISFSLHIRIVQKWLLHSKENLLNAMDKCLFFFLFFLRQLDFILKKPTQPENACQHAFLIPDIYK